MVSSGPFARLNELGAGAIATAIEMFRKAQYPVGRVVSLFHSRARIPTAL